MRGLPALIGGLSAALASSSIAAQVLSGPESIEFHASGCEPALFASDFER
jgi:hypothetical protein